MTKNKSCRRLQRNIPSRGLDGFGWYRPELLLCFCQRQHATRTQANATPATPTTTISVIEILLFLSRVGGVKAADPDERGGMDNCMVGGGAVDKVDIQINLYTRLCAPSLLLVTGSMTNAL